MKQHNSWLFRGPRFCKTQLPCEGDWRALLGRRESAADMVSEGIE
jgi:hypothetical protein